MTTKSKSLSITALAATLTVVQAQTPTPTSSVATPTASSPAAAAPELSPAEQMIKDIKNPVSWMTWGADFRLRNEYYKNAKSISNKAVNNEQDYFRFRPRIWTSITPVDDLSLNVRLTAEPRDYIDPSNSKQFNVAQNPNFGKPGQPKVGYTGVDWSYGIFDQLNIQWKNVLSQPVTLKVGRQDILLGEGWLTGDGTPLDGSWTAYQDAARMTLDLKDAKTTVDVIGLVDYAATDAWLPTINEQHRAVTDQNDRGAILYVANKSIPEAHLDGYFMYKQDNIDATLLNNPTGGVNQADNAHIYTLGGMLSGLCAEHWKYSLEGAYQFGDIQDKNIVDVTDPTLRASSKWRDLNAFGVNDKLIYQFNDSLKNQVGIQYEYATGDNPNTKADERFDLLWGRYPRWSDLYGFTEATEGRVYQTGNLHRFGPTWSIAPIKDMTFTLNYFALFADQEVATRVAAANQALFSNTAANNGHGNFRGHYLQSIARYRINPHVAAMLQGEVLFPGDFYASQTRPVESFVRAEMLFTF